MHSVHCEICGERLGINGTCPSCASQLEMEAIIGKHEALELGWSNIKKDYFALSDLDTVLLEPTGEECGCPLCTGDLGSDSAFRLYDDWSFDSDDEEPISLGLRAYHQSSQSNATRPQSVIQTKSHQEYVAFDLEIAKVIPDGALSWDSYRPFGISCAATLESDGSSRIWYGLEANGSIADKMARDEVVQLVRYLESMASSGKRILTWNGAGFDFSVLAEESGLPEICRGLAYRHVDMMFHLFCLKGFPLGLDKAAKGLRLPGKIAAIGGANAPRFWLEGRHQEVMEYALQDARTTLNVGIEVEKRHSLSWISGTGNRQFVTFPNGWLTVGEALRLPLPDTPWMTNPWPRSKFTDWIVREARH